MTQDEPQDDAASLVNDSDDSKKKKPWTKRKKVLAWTLGTSVPIVTLAVALSLICTKSTKSSPVISQDERLLNQVAIAPMSGLKLNETNYNQASIHDFTLASTTEPIVISQVQTNIPAAPAVDGNITYDVTLKLRNATRIRKVNVPYEVLINHLTISATKTSVNRFNWNRLTTADFTIDLGKGSTLATIEQLVLPIVMPAPGSDGQYAIKLKLGPLTRTVVINVPFIDVTVNVTTPRTVDSSTWDQLTPNDFILATTPSSPGFSIASVIPISPKPTTDSGIVTYNVTYAFEGVEESVHVDVPYDDSSDHNALVNATVTYGGQPLNELDFDHLQSSDFVLSNTGSHSIVISAVQSLVTSPSSADGEVNYAVTLTLNGHHDTRIIPVSYKPIINQLNVTSNLSAVNFMDWNTLQSGDFTIAYPSGTSSGATIINVTPPLQQPSGLVASYAVTIKFASLTRVVTIDVPYVQLVVSSSATKVVDGTNWNTLTTSDFTLDVQPNTQGFAITSVAVTSTQPTTTIGDVTYLVTYEYRGINKSMNVLVHYDNSASVLAHATVSYHGLTLNEGNFASATTANFSVDNNNTDAIAITDAQVNTSTAPATNGFVELLILKLALR